MRPIDTLSAPRAIGPYSQGIRVGNFLFISGQIPLDPASQKLIDTDIESQTERVIENIKGILNAAGLTLANVCKTTVFLKDMHDFARFNETYARHFRQPFPARSTVEVSLLPKDARIEIETIAYAP